MAMEQYAWGEVVLVSYSRVKGQHKTRALEYDFTFEFTLSLAITFLMF